MERLTVIVIVCLLAGLSECQVEVNGNQIDTEVQTNEILTTISTTNDQSCEPPIHFVLKELGALGERLDATVKKLEETNRKLEASEKKLSELNSTVTELRSERQGPRAAFSATLGIDGTIGPINHFYHLVFRNVVSNIGGHYSPITGYFTAPVNGAYFFTTSAFCWGEEGTCGGTLYHNETRIVSWYGYSTKHPTSMSKSAVLQLQAGDKVNIRLWHNNRISDNVNKYSIFSGFLLYQM